MARLFGLTIALVIYGSLYPWTFRAVPIDGTPLSTLLKSWPQHFGGFLAADAILNVLLYVPAGYFGILALARPCGTAAAAVMTLTAGVAVSLGVEAAQLFFRRDSSLLDVTANCLGTALGAVAAWLTLRHARARWIQRILQNADLAILAGCWIAYQILPVVPNFSQNGFEYRFQLSGRGGVLTISDFLLYYAETVVLLHIARELLANRAGTMLVLVLTPLKIALAGRVLTALELAAAVAAVFTFARIPVKSAAWLLFASVFIHGLAPLRLAQSPQAFSWKPFASSILSDWTTGSAILLGKAFRYGALVRLIGLASWPLAAAVLAVIEIVQRWLPGRSAEITDPLLVAVLAFAMWSAAGGVNKLPVEREVNERANAHS